MGQEAIKMLWTQLVKSEVPVRDWECEGKWAGKMTGTEDARRS